MITPRVTRLVRVPDLRAMQRALIDIGCGAADRATVIIVPTRSAAGELRRTIENVVLLERGNAAVLLPDVVTRSDFYTRLSERLPDAPPALTRFERDVLFRLAARAAEAVGTPAPFKVRPGLLAGILDFYDDLRRAHRSVDDFHRLLSGELEAVAESDRGAERLLRQADFLAAAFAEFERRTARTGSIDEHGLRGLLLDTPVARPYERIVVAVADQACDPHGLWMADFDLLARLPEVRHLAVVATERILAAGFHQRLHERHLPGIEDVRMGTSSEPPVLAAPPSRSGLTRPLVHTYRDREEELVGVARSLISEPPAASLERTAIVFQRPLPYLYLARHVFAGAHIPYQATDALPLAAEPFAAALDLVLEFTGSEATRASTVELLRSPLWTFADTATGRAIAPDDVASLDEFFRDVKYLGGWERLEAVAAQEARGGPALRAAAAAGRALEPLVSGTRASVQIDALRQFIRRHERLPDQSDAWCSRHLRARAAVLGGLESLRDAHERHDDGPVPFEELASGIRRWIEEQTFAPRAGNAGLMLLDAAAAPFADVDAIRIAGLVDGDWPERSSASIFFPARLLEPLGWPSPSDRLAGARARFQDLLRLPARTLSASSFSLEDDAIVAPSAFVEELGASGLVVHEAPAAPVDRIFDHEALSIEPAQPRRLEGEAARWLAFRQQLAPPASPEFHGAAGPRPPGAYAVSRIERYLECPFKYFAAHVLRLGEERDEESGLTPQERGRFLHGVFEAFFSEWHRAGRGAVTAATLEEGFAMFERIAEAHLDRLPEADRALERTYLLGSAVAPGLAERAFAFEIEHGAGVIERLLEHVLEGTFVFTGAGGVREITVKGKADRIDLLDDGTLRVVDYKIGKAPKLSRSLQLAVYSVCASRQLAGRHGRDWPVSRAGYVAFREKNAFVPLGANLAKALAEGEQRLVAAVTSIEAGSFPPQPEDPWLCSRCGYATVCRKDYVGDE